MNLNRKLKIFCCTVGCYEANQQLPGVTNAFEKLLPIYKANGDTTVSQDENSTSVKNKLLAFVKQVDANAADSLLFYYCGHGYLTGNDMSKLLLASYDTTETNYTAVGIEYSWVIEQLKRTGVSKIYIILDCCHSAIATKMGQSLAWNTTPEDNGIAVLTATTNPCSSAWQGKINGKEYAIFSYYLSQVLEQGVDENQVGISLKEIRNKIICLLNHESSNKYSEKPSTLGNNDLQSLPLFNNCNYKSARQVTRGIPAFEAQNRLKVLLVKTAIKHPVKDYDFGVPLGLWLLKSYILLNGINADVDVFDERLNLMKGENQQFESIIENYDVVGISICTCEVPAAIKKLAIAKRKNKITFVGGIFCSSNERYLLGYECIDYVIPGVSTVPLCNLLKEIAKKTRNDINYIPGVATKDNLDNFDVWQPSQLPYIELRVWKEIVDRYAPYLYGKIDIFTTRGCNRNCAFCSIQKECQHRTYRRDYDSVFDEIGYLYEKGFRTFSIKDENFLMNGLMPVKTILGKCKEQYPEIRFKIRARMDDVLNSGMTMDQMKSIGIQEIQYGLETPSGHLLQHIHKGYVWEADDQRDLINRTTSAGIIANCSFILGIEGESIEYYNSLRKFFSELENEKLLKIYMNFLTPHPYKNGFPTGNYTLLTNDLHYFTHKVPVCIPSGMTRMPRKTMIETYEAISRQYCMERFNPPIPGDIREAVVAGNLRVKHELPTYNK